MDKELNEAINRAHQAAECGDYYCGCWDGANGGGWRLSEDAEWTTPPWRHTEAFLRSLREQGFDVVRRRGQDTDVSERSGQ